MPNPHQWYRENKNHLRQYRGQWIAYDANGIIAHYPDYAQLIITYL